jgi:hypothetical protein
LVKEIEDQIKEAEEVKEESAYAYPQISFDVYWRTLCFLREVYKIHQSEANVLLVLNRNIPFADQEYKIIIPEQEVSGGSVDYAEGIRKIRLEEGEFFAGSIHSHPGFSAFQSGTDRADEINFEGLHLTFGQIAKDPIEIDQRVCLAGDVYTIKKACIDIEPIKITVSVPAELTLKIEELEQELAERGIKIDLGKQIGESTIYAQYPEFVVPEEWMALVSKKSYSYTGLGSVGNGYSRGWNGWTSQANAVLNDDVTDIDDFLVFVGAVADKETCQRVEAIFKNLYKVA